MTYTVEWSGFNAAVKARAAAETEKFRRGLVPPPVTPHPPTPLPPTPLPPAPVRPDTSGQFLRRAQGVALVVLALGGAAGLAIWAARHAPVGGVDKVTEAVVAPVPAPVALPPWQTNPPAPSSTQPALPEVVDYTRFVTRRAGSLAVVTGWKWSSSRSAAPSSQYCYVTLADPAGGASRQQDVARDGKPTSFDAAGMFPLTEEQHRLGLTNCVWFAAPKQAAPPVPEEFGPPD